MVFSSVTFLFYFLPVFLALYYVLPWKNGVLLVASLVFYAWGEPRFLPLLMASALLNYGFGLLIMRAGQHRKLALGLGVAANLAMLGYFKYAGFFTTLVNQALNQQLAVPAIVLPLGISFFVFQGLSYLLDVYRGDVDPQKSFWTFATYKAMFPQLIAGPIVRYRQVAADMVQRTVTAERIWIGFRYFIIGLAQKVLVANTVGEAADHLFAAGPAQLNTASAWLAVACYSIQILYDFAGYSNMAIGIGHMIGFTYPPNFNHPYSSVSVTEFWRRWHISLSTWFRDYLYIPLGGNRFGAFRTYVNLSIVFLLCGLWHGAALTFIVWGAWHGALLVLERAGLGKLLARLPRSIAQVYTLLMVMLGWVWFRAANLPTALQMLKTMFIPSSGGIAPHVWRIDIGPAQWTALVIGIALAVWRRPETPANRGIERRAMPLQMVLAVATLALCAASLAAGTYNPFIYFRF